MRMKSYRKYAKIMTNESSEPLFQVMSLGFENKKIQSWGFGYESQIEIFEKFADF